MQSEDVVFAGAPIGPNLMPSNFPMKGLRIAPVIPGGTAQEIIDAFADLKVQWKRGSQALSNSGISPPTTTEEFAVNGPDWIRSPGFNAFLIIGGQVGITYRVWWAIDCLEMVDVGSPPYLDGMPSGGGGGASALVPFAVVAIGVGPAGAFTTQAQNSTANIPTAPTAGVSTGAYGGATGIRAFVAAPWGQTITGGDIVWWRYDPQMLLWAETGVVESLPTGRRAASTTDQILTACRAGDGTEVMYAECRNVTTSGGGALSVNITVRYSY